MSEPAPSGESPYVGLKRPGRPVEPVSTRPDPPVVARRPRTVDVGALRDALSLVYLHAAAGLVAAAGWLAGGTAGGLGALAGALAVLAVLLTLR